MADVHTKEVRSYNMSQIKGKDTRPELLVRKFLFANGIRYRKNDITMQGKPDIVIKKYKTIVDIRGCFWHGHRNCRFGDKIKSESIEINERIKSAIRRDKINQNTWKQLGWDVIIIWDSCELEIKKRKSEKREIILSNLLNKIFEKSDSSN
jgi:DNA mismatch endonuclease (patch repair protein)